MGLAKRYGYCICHNTMSSLNAKGLCPIGAKERHEKSAKSKGIITKNARNVENLAISKGFTIKKKEDGICNRAREDRVEGCDGQLRSKDKSFKKTKTKINYRSEKGKELAKQELLLFQKLFQERPPSCEYCGTEITVFNPTNYHHVRTKGSHPELRLVESNIVKICIECHLKEHGFKPRKNGND